MLQFAASWAESELTYIKRSSDTKDVITGTNWTVELGVQNSFDVPIVLIYGVLQRD